jgi:hypothetical protein
MMKISHTKCIHGFDANCMIHFLIALAHNHQFFIFVEPFSYHVQAFPQFAQSTIFCLPFLQYNFATAKIITCSMLGTFWNYYKLGENDINVNYVCKKTFVKVFTRSLKMAFNLCLQTFARHSTRILYVYKCSWEKMTMNIGSFLHLPRIMGFKV